MMLLRLPVGHALALTIGFLAFIASACTDQTGVALSGGDLAVASSEGTVDLNPPPGPSQTVSPDPADATPSPSVEGVEPAPTPTLTSASATPEPTAVVRPVAPNGRAAPAVATSASELADQIARAEAGLADPTSTIDERSDWGHLHQIAIRKLGYEPDWDVDVFEALPPELVPRTLLHVSARRSLIDLSSGYSAADFVPAWAIVNPEPATMLLDHYRNAEAATGIGWEYLAAINLVETGMGRIRGLSSAGAQGPMQFLPTTWAEAGIGEGDINDPGDAIAGAARYLVRRGGPGDMTAAIWGYNNSDNYVTAVQAYAELLRQDPTAYEAIYNWEIYFFTEAGDVWLPTGFRTDEVIDLADFLAANPWSEPDAGLR